MRPIDADKLTTKIKREYCWDCLDNSCDYCWVMDSINYLKNAPQIEAELIRHAHWITTDCFIKCSNCGIAIQNEHTPYAKHCIYCGATMDEEDSNETD